MEEEELQPPLKRQDTVLRKDSMKLIKEIEAKYAKLNLKYLDDLKESQYFGIQRPSGVQMRFRKLPMWGGQVHASKLNFEWPTKSMLTQWPADVSIKSLRFKVEMDGSSYISSIACTLTNNQKSPII